jgi:TrmH family RNA methyltransferase
MTLTNAQIKLIKSLDRKKVRDEHKLFIVEGVKQVFELLKSDFIVETICFSYSSDEEALTKAISGKSTQLVKVSVQVMERITHFASPSPILAVVQIPSLVLSDDFIRSSHRLLLLDEIKDPGNLGSIIRNADWFGFDAVYVSNNSVDLYNPKSVSSSMGSLFHLPIVNGSFSEFIERLRLQGFTIVGSSLDGNQHPKVLSSFRKLALIIGSESFGIRRKIVPMLDETVKIPAYGKAESLNAAVAAGILAAFCRE